MAPGPSSSSSPDEKMEAVVGVEDFLNSGRTGRRNAVPDISDAKIGSISTAGVDFSFDKLSVTDAEGVTKTTKPSPEHKDPKENKPGGS
ncbi:unnamed protein product [Lymnaea stagnalis]|uniref:cAMP-dependent protein kinase inhibitor beta n=1 Tax=Lymnaea stagnalis TaxID=6523 RepID=A0AAV2HXY1_LYMST